MLLVMPPQPQHITPDQWRAFETEHERLDRAWESEDFAQVLGVAKELCETVAKIVLQQVGTTTLAHNANFPTVVNAAQDAIGRQHGSDLADDPITRSMAQSAKKLVLGVGELRNQLGTGHGRATPPEVIEEHATVAHEAARLWTGWVLRRLDHVALGRSDSLVRELREGASFTQGRLRQRLDEIGLSDLPEDESRRVGVAVAQRAVGGTFTVREDGMESVAESPESWPASYLVGLVEGTFLDANGYVRSSPAAVKAIAPLLATVPGAESILRGIRDQVELADSAYAFTDPAAVRDAMYEAEPHIPGLARAEWDALAGAVAPA